MLAQARWSPGEVVLDDAARRAPLRRPRRADARGARRERAGRGLFDWLRGRPWPGAPSERARRPSRASRSSAGASTWRASTRAGSSRTRERPAPARRPCASGSTAPEPQRMADALRSTTSPAPAKLNLFLHVVGKRADGYPPAAVAVRADRLVRHAALRAPRRRPRSPATTSRAALPADDLCLRAARALQAASAAPRSAPTSRSTSACRGAPAWAAAAPTPPRRCWR